METAERNYVNIEDEMRRSYLDYAMSVIIGRALPDVRDGFKPVHRRVLWAMHELGNTYNKPFKKSARVVGDCIGKYHPHGESAVYDTIVRMAQDFSMRYQLIDGQGNFGCFTGDTKIKLLDGTEKSFAELAELNPNEIFYVYSVDKSGRIVIGEGRHSRITRRNARLIELTLDNGAKIRCTPDHRFMLRDGTYKAAEELTEADSLMPGYFDIASVKEGLNEYLRVRQPVTGEYQFVHHLADEFNAQKQQVKHIKGAFVRHHKNFNRWDNRPTNIERMAFLEHLHLHAEHLEELWKDETFRKAQREGVQRYYDEHPEVVEKRRQRFIRQNQDETFRQENGPRVSSGLKRLYQDNAGARAEISRRMKALWADPDYRAKMNAALSGIEKRELSTVEKARVAQIISEKSRAMWKDEAKRAEIVDAISRALASAEVRAKISANTQRLWRNPEYRAKYTDDHHSRMAHTLWENPAMRDKHRAKIARQREDQSFRDAQRVGVQRSNARRMSDNPQMIMDMAARAAQVLTEKWTEPAYKRQVIRQRIARYGSDLLVKVGRENVTPDLYEKHRKSNWIPRIETALKYFNDFDELLDAAQNYNHRVVTKRFLDERADVYDITVDVHHNFLLADGVFVHNSVDGDSPAAMRYCVTGDTLVVTDKGLLPIGSISKGDEDITARVLSHGREVNKASKWWDSGVHPVRRVRTRLGFEITGTANHPLLVFRADAEGKPGFAWKLISQLQPGDVLALDRSEELWPEGAVPLTDFHPQIAESSRTVRHSLPETLTEDLAFLLGALTAEGTVQEQRIEFCNNRGEFADAFVAAWQRVFPTCRLHIAERKPSSYGKQPYLQMQIVSLQVVEFLRNLGLRGRSGSRRVPGVVLRAPQAVAAAFLRGLFEGDGSVERSGRSLLRVSLCSQSETMLKQVQTILLRFGIVAGRLSDASHHRLTHRLTLNGRENLIQFSRRIGFISTAKQVKLAEVITVLTGKSLAKSDYIPLMAVYLRRRAVSQRDWMAKNNFDRPARLRAALPRLVTALSASDYAMVEYLSRTNYLFDSVSVIEDAGEQHVYSLRVDSACHSFVANGFINHNTEVRMHRLTEEVLADIEKETVNFLPNYDESLSEPSVLPTRIPNLLLNGAEGIAVGMATKIPPHNLTEIIDATIALIRKPAIKLEELIKLVPGPDFPTGGFIYGREGIKQAYLTGRGVIQMRARAGIDRIGRGSSERDAVVITEIPFQVNKARLIERIAELVNEKKIEGIADLRDESDRTGMRIVVELKRDAVPQVILNKLYKLTPMQSSFGVINLAILGGQPRILNLKQMLEAFVEFRREVVRRRTEYDLRKARARAHILEGLNKAIDALDYIVPLIRNARSVDEARAWLMGNTATMSEVKSWKGVPSDLTLAGFLSKLQRTIARLAFSEQQAQAILDLQLRRLSALERQKILDEYEQIIRLIAELEEILANEASLRRVIINELEDIKKAFGDKRRTEIVDEGVELTIEDLIADEDVAITVTNSGYIKRTPVTAYSRQGRGGKGRFGAAAKGGDFVEHLFIASTHAYVMIFTDDGQVYKLKVHEIPDAPTAARGKAIVNLINIPSERKIAGVVPVREFSEGRYVVMVTRKGVIKKTSLAEFQNIRSNGINAVNVDDGDELLDVVLTDGTKRILIATHDGIAIRFDEEDVRPMGRAARGVRGIDLRQGDYVVSVCALSADDTERMLSVSEQGYGKQTKISDYRLQSRGGRGVINMKTTPKTGKVVAVFPVDDESEIMIITQHGKLIRIEAGEIRKTGRSASGVRLIKTEQGDRVTSASLLEPSAEEEIEATAE